MVTVVVFTSCFWAAQSEAVMAKDNIYTDRNVLVEEGIIKKQCMLLRYTVSV